MVAEFFKTILNIRSLRAACRELSFEQLEEAWEKLGTVLDERRVEEEQERKKRQEEHEKKAHFLKLLAEAGIDPKELVSGGGDVAQAEKPAKAKRAPRPAKYQFMDGGEMKTWTGQGRMPSALAAQLQNGKLIDDFLIQ